MKRWPEAVCGFVFCLVAFASRSPTSTLFSTSPSFDLSLIFTITPPSGKKILLAQQSWPQNTMAIPSFIEFLFMKKIGEGLYETVHNPIQMGNALPIAYGGCVLAWSCQAAHLALPKDSIHRIYSIQGNYLGPTASDRPVQLQVTSLRETRTFSTKLVLVSQKTDDGKKRSCLSCIVDFYVTSKNDLLKYSNQPIRKVTHHSNLMDTYELHQHQVKQGILTQSQADRHATTFTAFKEWLINKPTPEGIGYENCIGINYKIKTSQDELPITSKVNYDWFKPKETPSQSRSKLSLSTNENQEKIPLKSDPNNSTALDSSLLTFIMDRAIAFIPLTFSNKFLYHAKNCSSLDFSLRFHVDDLNLDDWHLSEMKTMAGSDERTYSEANCWKENIDGSLTLVATMTQASILRGPEQHVEEESRL